MSNICLFQLLKCKDLPLFLVIYDCNQEFLVFEDGKLPLGNSDGLFFLFFLTLKFLV